MSLLVRHELRMKLVTCLLVQELTEKESEDGVFKMLSIDVTRFLTTILIGTTVVNIGATTLVTKAAMSIFGEAGVSAATGVMTVAVLLLTKLTPKSIVVHNATEVARFVVRPVAWISLNIISCGKSCYMSIKSEALASQAHHQLYGLCFLGKVLSVERANKPTENNKNQQGAGQSGKHSSSLTNDSTPNRDLNEGSKLGSFSASDPIAERLGVDYPFPPHLEYVFLFPF
ncbi:U11/U12 small nuclear ribonucleoprotein 65 kDa protein-like [Camellia sinensis]|uniref:U11/U12 small nuclear ribonucleoprotein 65 kDa protein-like n=1 Tax=Camellia sinensis TaxID=4442 RepID=UPI001036A443|nr:U11/U12 small nuclear ribonucleoprotein 65 kDa protein-like [Camellia sinensis]